MLKVKTLVLASAILALAYSNSIPSSNKSTQPAVEPSDLEACPGTSFVDTSPTLRMNANLGEVESGTVGAQVQCMVTKSDPKSYYTKVSVASNVYDPTAEVPPLEDPVPDNDDLEHIKIYFANDKHQILEIKLNRFTQKSVRLLSKPYNELKSTDLPELTCTFPAPVDGKWTADCYIEAALLPANVTKINVVDVNPINAGSSRYLMNYRLYNHPISIYDSQVVTKYMKFDNPENVVNPESNNEDSEYWTE